jgi:hypothetical protein
VWAYCEDHHRFNTGNDGGEAEGIPIEGRIIEVWGVSVGIVRQTLLHGGDIRKGLGIVT